MALFNGVNYPTPTIVYTESDNLLAATGGIGATEVIVIDQSLGGTPGTNPNAPDGSVAPVNVFRDANSALKALRGGPGCWKVQRLFQNGARTVYYIRANPATPSTLTLNDAGAAASINLTSQGYGIFTTLVTVAVSAGTNQSAFPGSKKVVVTDTAVTPNVIVSKDNLWNEYLQTQYIGTGSAATITVNGTNLITNVTGYNALTVHYVGTSSPATVTVAITGGNLVLTSATGGESQTFSLASYTMASLVAAINAFTVSSVKIYNAVLLYGGQGGSNAATTLNTQSATDCKTATPTLTATGQDLNLAFSTYNTLDKLTSAILSTGAYTVPVAIIDSSLFSADLDYQSAADIKTAALSMTAIQKAVLDFFNNDASTYVYAARAGGKPPANVAATYMTGGSEGTAMSADWSNCFTRAQQIDAPYMLLGATDLTTQQLGLGHVKLMDDGQVGHRPRIIYTGGPAGQLLTDAITAARTLNDKRIVYFWPALRNPDPSGAQRDARGNPLIIDQDATYTAAIALGIKSSDVPQRPLTRALIPTVALKYEPTADDFAQAARYGVATVIKNPGDGLFYVGWAKTTWNGEANFARNEESVVAATQYTHTVVIDTVNDWLKTRPVNSNTAAVELKGEVKGALVRLMAQDVIVGFDEKKITVSAVNDQVTVCFEDSPTEPINFVFIQATHVPTQISV